MRNHFGVYAVLVTPPRYPYGDSARERQSPVPLLDMGDNFFVQTKTGTSQEIPVFPFSPPSICFSVRDKIFDRIGRKLVKIGKIHKEVIHVELRRDPSVLIEIPRTA